MTAFIAAMFVLPAAVIALALYLAHKTRKDK